MRNVVALISAFTLACGAASAPSPATTTAVAATQPVTATTAATTAAPRTSPPRTATPTLNPAFAEVTLRWDSGANISDIDEVTDIVAHLKERPGIEGGYGDETQIVLAYDPQKITVEQIRRLLADMGHPTKVP